MGIRATQSTAEVSVRDFGPGLTPETEDKLRRLARMGGALPSPALDVAGPGFGLFIAFQLVRLHAGALHARSQPGTGATFTITLSRAR